MFGKIKCKNCGAKNPKNAKFCKECGSNLKGTICSGCGAPINPDDKFCPNCGSSITQIEVERKSKATPIAKETGKIKVWSRMPQDFARRLEIKDIKGILTKKITIESGTKALFLQGGRFFGELPPGTYTVGGALKAIKDLNLSEKATVILVDDSDTELNFSISGLRTSEEFPAGAIGTLVISIENPIMFFNNLMKGRDLVKTTDIEDILRNEMKNILQSKIKQHSFDDLYGNLELKQEIAQDFEHLMNTTLSRLGLRLIHLKYFDYEESYWKDVLEKRREESIEKQRAKIMQSARERILGDKIHALKTEAEIAKYIDEIDKNKLLRSYEKDELIIDLKAKLEEKELLRKQKAEVLEKEHELELKRKEEEYQLEKEGKEDELDRKELEMGLDALRDLKAIKREHEIEMLDARSKATVEALIASTSDRETKAHLAELKKTEIFKGMTDEQILSVVAKDSPEAARAIAERYKAMASEERLKEHKDFVEKLEKMAEKAMEQMGAVASTRAQTSSPTTVVSGGGGYGQPVIVGGPKVEKVIICSECKAEIPLGTKFCTNCGSKIGKEEKTTEKSIKVTINEKEVKK